MKETVRSSAQPSAERADIVTTPSFSASEKSDFAPRPGIPSTASAGAPEKSSTTGPESASSARR